MIFDFCLKLTFITFCCNYSSSLIVVAINDQITLMITFRLAADFSFQVNQSFASQIILLLIICCSANYINSLTIRKRIRNGKLLMTYLPQMIHNVAPLQQLLSVRANDNLRSFAIFRSKHQKCSIKKGILKTFTRFTGKHLCQNLFLIKL